MIRFKLRGLGLESVYCVILIETTLKQKNFKVIWVHDGIFRAARLCNCYLPSFIQIGPKLPKFLIRGCFGVVGVG